MALDAVGSTSWHNRHLGAFERLNRLLLEEGPSRPTIMIVGPGGVTRLLAPLLNNSARKAHLPRKLVGDVARYGDQLLRRIPLLPLVSLESLEVSRTLTMPHDLIVVDRSRRVLEGVKRDLRNALVHCVDISRDSIPARADVVIAFNVVCRLEPALQSRGMSVVSNCVKAGGWLLMDDRSAKAHLIDRGEFEAISEKTYRRTRPADATIR